MLKKQFFLTKTQEKHFLRVFEANIREKLLQKNFFSVQKHLKKVFKSKMIDFRRKHFFHRKN